MWPDNDPEVLQVLAELMAGGLTNVSYRDGQWVHLTGLAGTGMPGLGVRPLPSADVQALNQRVQELKGPTPSGEVTSALDAARAAVAAGTGGRYAIGPGGGWMAGGPGVGPTGGLRQRGGFISERERASLERQATEVADEGEFAGAELWGGAGGGGAAPTGRTYTTGEVANLLGVNPETVRAHAHRLGIPRQGRTWVFTEQDLSRLRDSIQGAGGEEGEEEGGAAGGGGRGGGLGGALSGPLAAATGFAGVALGAGSNALRGLVGFLENALGTALSAAGGLTGAGLARIGSGIANLLSQGLAVGAQAVLGIGTAVMEAVVGGLRLVGNIAMFAIGGALLGIFVGALGAIASGLGEAFGRAVGAVSQAASEALQGVVSVLRDLVQTGRQLSQEGMRMRGLAGVRPGQDIEAMMFGRAAGADVGGMFSTWRDRPEFAGPRLGAVGAQFNPQDLVGSTIAAVEAIRRQPEFLQLPFANIVSGGRGEELMKLVMLPPERLREAAGATRELGLDPALLQRIFNSLEPMLNKISMVFTGLKLEILEATLPHILIALRSVYALWHEHRQSIDGFLHNTFPELIGRGIQGLLLGTAAALGWLERGYHVAREVWEWLRGSVWPILQGIGRGFQHVFGGGEGGVGGGVGAPGGAAPWGTAGGPGSGGEPPGDRVQRWTETAGHAVKWALENPVLALGGGVLAYTLLHEGAKFAHAQAVRIPGLGAAGIGLGIGLGTAALASQVENPWAQAGIQMGGIVAATVAGFARGGGPLGGIIAGGTAAVTEAGLGTGYFQAKLQEQQNLQDEQARQARATAQGYVTPKAYAMQHGMSAKEFEREGLGELERGYFAEVHRVGRPAGGVMGTGIEDPVTKQMHSWQEWLRQQATSYSPENIRRAIAEGQLEANRQQQARDLGTLKVQVDPSPEFAARMEYQQSLALLRSIQLAVG